MDGWAMDKRFHFELTPEEQKAGVALYERIWEDIQGQSPDVVSFAWFQRLRPWRRRSRSTGDGGKFGPQSC
jgi:hypothetical protein